MKYRHRLFTESEYNSMMGMTASGCDRRILKNNTDEAVAREKEEICISLCKKRNLRIEEDARSFIRRLNDDGIKVVIASSAPKANMDWYYESSGIKELFRKEYIIAGREDLPSKPESDIFRLVLEIAHVSPEKAICFEDSPNGLRAAIATTFKKTYCISSPGFDDSVQRTLAPVIDWEYTLTHYSEVTAI